MQEQEIYRKAIKHWGEELQVGMLMEEMAELTIAINKFRRSAIELGNDIMQSKRKDIAEEIADVKIMLEQIKVLFNISDYEISSQYQKKLIKLEKMIENGEK